MGRKERRKKKKKKGDGGKEERDEGMKREKQIQTHSMSDRNGFDDRTVKKCSAKAQQDYAKKIVRNTHTEFIKRKYPLHVPNASSPTSPACDAASIGSGKIFIDDSTSPQTRNVAAFSRCINA